MLIWFKLTWCYILNLCKNMSEDEASLVVTVLLIAATSLWSGSLVIGAVLTLVIVFAILVTFPLWGALIALAVTIWHAVKTIKRAAMQASVGTPKSQRRLPG